jgi:putative DNA primase/helicase
MTVNLATDEQYAPRAEDYCTKITRTRCDRAVATPIWNGFLDRVTAGDRDLQAYLKRVAGYCCTGHTYEHVLFFPLRHRR